MDRDDERRGQKRHALSAELLARRTSQLLTFPGARDFSAQSKDFGTTTFLTGEFHQPLEANVQTVETFAYHSKEFGATSSKFNATNIPSTCHGKKFHSEMKQTPIDISAKGIVCDTCLVVVVVIESNIPNIFTSQSENVLASEQFSSTMTLAEQGLAQDSFQILKDTHDTFSELFPSFSSFLSKGSSGIGTEGSQNVECISETFESAPDISFKPAYFEQPAEEDLDDQPASNSTSSNVLGSDEIYPGSRLSVHESVMAILTFAQTERLTGAAVGRLLRGVLHSKLKRTPI
ncbi:hypothetical protein KUF71_004294 [Frankliniella fusca]|uniref:Uncharacterized protein n=1 Tax=Frankliniella fusca TaxID=407009 RepID=A0AAE1L8M6_9NEOP|nr:hypothetical protein KUF71_004294 [Frankliniella fusca]